MELPIIDCGNVILNPLSLRNLNDLFEFTSREDVTEFLSWDCHKEIEVTKSFLEEVIETYAKPEEPSQWGIILKSTGKLIGITGFISIDLEHERGEIAYIMSPDYSGKGFMTEANKTVLKYGFSHIGLNRIQAKAELANVGSQKVLLKLKFIKEGIFRDFLKVKGTFRTYIYYSILKNEYNKVKLT